MRYYGYNNQSDNRAVTKNLTYLGYGDCAIKGECSILSPTFTITGMSDSTMSKFNYVYIPDWGRYYYVDNITAVLGKSFEISCYVDVLKTYASQIRSLNGFVRRQEFEYNDYIPDVKIPARDTRNFTFLKVGDMPSGGYYLTVNH